MSCPEGPTTVGAVLFDRDGTLIEDVPYNGDPDMVRPMPGAVAALRRLRAAGLRTGVVTNQSGVARGLLTLRQVTAVNQRVEQLLGPFDTWQICPHGAADGCACRKPRPGLVLAAARQLGVAPRACVMVGDIGADVEAARSAGARAVLVPTPVTRPEEVAAATVVLPDLTCVADWVLEQIPGVRASSGDTPPAEAPATAPSQAAMTATPRRRVLVVRTDSDGDVLLTGPAIRAVAAGASHLTLLCGPRGRQAAELLPGVTDILQWRVPWIDPHPDPVDRAEVENLVSQLAAAWYDEALIFTSFHQSPLPMALLLRMAGVARISAISEDYPGSLLDVRHRVPAGIPEPERALSLARAAGFSPPAGDHGGLAVTSDLPEVTGLVPPGPYVVLHPGASVPARACPPPLCAAMVQALTEAGFQVVVTGGPEERELTRRVAGTVGYDLGGRTRFDQLAAVLARADCVVVGNTGPAHLAAAVGTPVVSLFAPTVPYAQWGPYGVPSVRLGDQDAPCRGSRATECPVPGHPCLSTITPAAVVSAVTEMTRHVRRGRQDTEGAA